MKSADLEVLGDEGVAEREVECRQERLVFRLLDRSSRIVRLLDFCITQL